MKSKELIKKVLKIVDSDDKNQIKIIIFFMIISMFVEMISLAILIPVIDYQNKYEKIIFYINKLGLTIDIEKKSLFYKLILVVVIVYLFKFIFLTFSSWYQTKFISNLQKKLSQKLFNKYLNLNYQNYISKNTATLLNNIVREVNLLVGGTISPFLILISEFIVVTSILIMFIFSNPFSALFLIIFFASIVILSVFFTKNKIKIWGEKRLNSDIKRTKILQMALNGYKELKTYNTENYFLKNYSISNDESAKMMQFQNFTQQLPRLVLEIFSIIGIMFLIVTLLFKGNDISNIIPLVGIAAAASFRILPSANRLLISTQALKFGTSTVNLIYDEFNEIQNPHKQINIQTRSIKFNFKENIEFRNISFKYDNKDFVFENFNFTISKNDFVGLIGMSGSGKSTLINLLIGLIEPISGEIILDGKENINTNIDAWRKNIGFVPQDIFLIDSDIKSNIAFGIDEDKINLEKLNQVIEMSDLVDLVDALPNGINTQVGERGVLVSGGQKQRIGIARALYRDPELIIFDEGTSALDEITETNILNTLHKISKEKTIILSTHKIENLKFCNKVLNLNSII